MRYSVFGPLRYADFWGFAVRDSNGGGGGGGGDDDDSSSSSSDDSSSGATVYENDYSDPNNPVLDTDPNTPGTQGSSFSTSNDDDSYTVQSGDTLSEIAEANDMSVAEIMDANPGITNANQIQSGASLDLSGAGSGSPTYDGGVGLSSGNDNNSGGGSTTTTTTTVPTVYYDAFGNSYTTAADRNTGEDQAFKQESWSNPSNWIVTSTEQGDLDKQYIGDMTAPTNGAYTVPSYASINTSTSDPASSLDIVLDASGVPFVTDQAGNRFSNVDDAVSSDVAIGEQVASYEDPSNYRIDVNQQDELIRVYVGDSSAPPITYETPSWEQVDTAQEGASDKDDYYDLTFVDGERKVLDAYNNAFDTPAEATSNEIAITDRLDANRYEVIEDAGGVRTKYVGEYDTPKITIGGTYAYEAPSTTDVLNATTYKDKDYTVSFDEESGTTSAFDSSGNFVTRVQGVTINDTSYSNNKTIRDAGYEYNTPAYEEQYNSLLDYGELFLDENKDGIPDDALPNGYAAYLDGVKMGQDAVPSTKEEAASFGTQVSDFAKSIGVGVINTVASTAQGVDVAKRGLAASEVESFALAMSFYGSSIELDEALMGQLFADEEFAKNFGVAEDKYEFLTNYQVEGGDGRPRSAALVYGDLTQNQDGIKNAMVAHGEAMTELGVVMDDQYWSALSDTLKDSASSLLSGVSDPTGTSSMIGQGLGSALSFGVAALPALALAPLGLSAAAATAIATTSGALMNMGSMYDEAYDFALQQTGDPVKANDIAMQGASYYAAIGSLEGLPIARALGFVPPQFGNQIVEFFADVITEGGQEGLNNTLNNLVTQGIWDPERGMFDGTLDAVVLGTIVGGIVSSGGRMTQSMVKSLKDNGYSETDIDMIKESDGGIITGEMSSERIQSLLDRGYTVDQISSTFGSLTGANTINAMTDAPEQMTIEGLAANSAFQNTAIKTGSGDPAIMYGNPANNMFSITSGPDLAPVYLDVQNPLTLESIGTPKGKETLTEIFGSERAGALISDFQQTGRITLNGNDVKKVSDAGYDGVVDNDSGKVYVTDNVSVYSVTDPETTTEETVVATKPEWKTQLDEAFSLTGSIDLDLAKQVEQEFGISPTDINAHYQSITASDQAWEQRLLDDYLTKGYIDLDTMLKAEEDFGVSMQELGNYSEYLDSDLSVYNDKMFADNITEVRNLTESQTSLQSEVTSLTNELSAVEADLIDMTSNRDLDSEAASTAIAKQEELSKELSDKKKELAGVEKTLGETKTSLETETKSRSTAEQSVTSLTTDLETANKSITALDTSLTTANETITGLNTTIEGLGVEVETAEAATLAADEVVTKLNEDITFKNDEITGLETDVKAAEDAVLAKQDELDVASANAETSAETITGLNAELTALEQTKTGLEGDLSTATGERDSLQGTLDTRTTERDDLQKSLTSSNTQLEAANTQLTAANTQVTDLTSQKEVLTESVATLTTNLNTANTSLTTALETSGANAALAEELTEQLGVATTSISDLQSTIDSRAAEVTALEVQLSNEVENRTLSDNELALTEDLLGATRAEIEELTANLSTETQNKADLQTKLEAAQGTIGTRDETIQGLTGQLDTSNTQIASLETQLGTSNENVSRLTGELQAAEASNTATVEEKAALAQSLEAAQAESAGLTTDISGLTTQRDSLQVELEAAQGTIGTRDETIQGLTGQLDTSNTQIASLETQLGTSNENVSRLTGELQAAEASNTATVEEKAALAQSLEAAQAESAGLTTDISGLTTQRDSLQVELDNTNLSLSEAEGSLATSSETIVDLTSKLGVANQDIGGLSSQLDQATQNVTSLETQLNEANSSLTATETEKSVLAQELESARDTAQGLSSDLSTRTTERDNLQTNLTNTKATLSATVGLATTLQANLDTSNAEIGALGLELDTATQNVVSLEATLNDAQALQSLTEAEKSALQNDLNASKADVSQLTSSLEARSSERDGLQDQLAETQGELDASTQLSTSLQNNLDTAQSNILGLESQLGDTQALQQMTEEQRAALEADLAQQKADAEALQSQLGEVSSAFDITQTQLGFAQDATTYVDNQLNQNVDAESLVSDLVTRGYSAVDAQSLVDNVQQNRFDKSELARITDAQRRGAYIPFGSGSIGTEEDDQENVPTSYGGPTTNTNVYTPPGGTNGFPPLGGGDDRFDPFDRTDATPVSGGPAVELDQYGQPVMSYGGSGRPLGSYITMPTDVPEFEPWRMEMPENPYFNPQEPVVQAPFPQQPLPVINQGIGGLGRKNGV